MAFENFLHAFDHAFGVDPVHDKKHARKEAIASVHAQRNTRASAAMCGRRKHDLCLCIEERERERKSVAFVTKAAGKNFAFPQHAGFSFCPKKSFSLTFAL